MLTVSLPQPVLAQRQIDKTHPTAAQPYLNRPVAADQWAISNESDHGPYRIGERAQGRQSVVALPQAQTTYWWGVFQSFRTGNGEIYRVRGSGVDFAQLTFHPAADILPRFNNDAAKIVFVSERDGNPEIYRMAANGADQTRLTVNDAVDTQPSWSPDSNAIVFVSDRSGNSDLYVMSSQGGSNHQLTADPALDFEPDWSPDGTQILWVRAVGDFGWLWVMDRDGGNAHALSGALRYLQHPRWSPDGSTIGFDYDADSDGVGEIGLLTLATGVIQTVLDLSPAAPTEGRDLRMNSWTPTGDGMQYTSGSYFWRDNNGLYEISIYDVRTAGLCLPERCNVLAVSLFGNDADSDSFLDVRSSDNLPPQSAVDPLPAFVRYGSLFISWTATDPGGSGAVLYDVDYRTATDAIWRPWLSNTYLVGEYFDPFRVENAQTLYFRSRAIDDAENVEAWPQSSNGDTGFTYFASAVAGRVTDMRGVGREGQTLPVLPPALNPARTNATGDYFVRLPLTGEYQLNGLRINTSADRFHAFYVDPPQNLIQNGDFEGFPELTGWHPSGTITPTLTVNNVSSGLQGAHLGFACATQCVAVDTSALQPDGDGNYFPLWTADDHLQLFYSAPATAGSSNLYYTKERAPGDWSEPFLLGPGSARGMQAVSDRDGNLFVATPAMLPAGNTIVTIAYSPTTGWGPAVLFDGGQAPRLAIGGDGSLHILYLQQCAPHCWESALIYRWRPAQGNWSAPIVVSDTKYDDYQLLVGEDNTAHLLWYEQNERFIHSNSAPRLLQYQQYRHGASVGAAIVADAQGIWGAYHLDPENKLFAFGVVNSGILFTETPLRNPDMDALYIVDSYHNLISWSSDNTLHLLAPDRAGSGPWHYLYKAKDQSWSAPQPIELGDYFPESLHVDGTGQFQALTHEGYLLRFPPKLTVGSSTLAQSVTIPADLHQPTLSWMAETQGSTQKRSNFQVTISDALRETVIYSTTATAPWRLTWVDLTRWAGKTVTVTFAVTQANDDIPFHVSLDHVALGAWTTPVPQTVTPAVVDAGLQTTIVISGENFIATPQVKLGETSLTNVRLLSVTAIEATVPDNIPLGIHDLTVTNPDGTRTVLPTAVKVGKQLYVPLVAR